MIQLLSERLLPFALTLSILVFAVSSMLMVGLRYTVADLLRPLRDIPGVSVALVTNFILVPLLAWALLRVFPLASDYATGLVIVASAAGAPLLVKLAMNAKEDVGFAASLIVLLLVGTIIAMPFVIRIMTAEGRIGAWAIARPLLLNMMLPLIIGFILRPLVPTLAQRAVPVLAKVLTVALWVMVILSLFLNRSAVLGIFGEGAIVASVLFIALAFVLGYLTGIVDKSERVVLGFGASQRNFAAAMVVAREAFDAPGVLVMVIVLSLVAMLLIPFSTFLGRRKAARGASSPPSS